MVWSIIGLNIAWIKTMGSESIFSLAVSLSEYVRMDADSQLFIIKWKSKCSLFTNVRATELVKTNASLCVQCSSSYTYNNVWINSKVFRAICHKSVAGKLAGQWRFHSIVFYPYNVYNYGNMESGKVSECISI